MSTPRFEIIAENLYRLKVPFENIYTAVFLIKGTDGYMLVDCATTKEDVEQTILPAIKVLNIKEEQITHILITHPHGDHAGGLRCLLSYLPDAVVFAGSDFIKERLMPKHFVRASDGENIDKSVVAVSLPGHCADMLGYYDTRNETLITGDAVQLCGVGRYGCGLGSFRSYFATLEKIEKMRPSTLVASHDYYPKGAIARGDGEINAYLCDSREYAFYIKCECERGIDENMVDSALITERIKQKNAEVDVQIHPLQRSTVHNCLCEILN
jgi:glyoxylase-like metal-dependent hydrolase (beta-lactamase superfamily II)